MFFACQRTLKWSGNPFLAKASDPKIQIREPGSWGSHQAFVDKKASSGAKEAERHAHRPKPVEHQQGIASFLPLAFQKKNGSKQAAERA